MRGKQAYLLYTCHLLTTWNARTYEFAVVLFTAAAFPDGLIVPSLIGITTSLGVILFAPALGQWVDNEPSRLRSLQISIHANRIAIIVASLCWFFLVNQPVPSNVLIAGALLVGVFERLSRTMNLFSIERDWVPTIAQQNLTGVNAIMARIDLICKVLAPLAFSPIVSHGSARLGVEVLAGMSAVTWGVEIWTARVVWSSSHLLQQLKVVDGGLSEATSIPWLSWLHKYIDNVFFFFSTEVWIPATAMAMLHSSILTFSSTMTVFLLHFDFSIDTLTWARAVASVFEIGGTFVMSQGVKRKYFAGSHDKGISYQQVEIDLDSDQEDPEGMTAEPEVNSGPNAEKAVCTLGQWGLAQMLLSLFLAGAAIFLLPGNKVLHYALLFFIASSRLGHAMFELTTQQLAQTRVAASHRSSFAGAETTLISLFGLSHWIGSAIFSRLEDFKWLSLGSVVVVAGSLGMYSFWLRRVYRSRI